MLVAGTFIGTIFALRLMAINAEERGTRLTVRGRIVVGLALGILVGITTLVFGGLWWDCDLTQPGSVCAVGWGY